MRISGQGFTSNVRKKTSQILRGSENYEWGNSKHPRLRNTLANFIPCVVHPNFGTCAARGGKEEREGEMTSLGNELEGEEERRGFPGLRRRKIAFLLLSSSALREFSPG